MEKVCFALVVLSLVFVFFSGAMIEGFTHERQHARVTEKQGPSGRMGTVADNRFYTYSTFKAGDKYLGSWVESK